jgi:hypothetical protein
METYRDITATRLTTIPITTMDIIATTTITATIITTIPIATIIMAITATTIPITITKDTHRMVRFIRIKITQITKHFYNIPEADKYD